MIILDTNIISEPLRLAPETAVIDWLDAQAPSTLYVTTITLAKVRFDRRDRAHPSLHGCHS